MNLRLVAIVLIAALLIGVGLVLTRTVVHGESRRYEEQTLRLALWRLEARVSALVLAEASRAPESYHSLLPAPGNEVRPSPLVSLPESPLWLHLRMNAGKFTSPQVPISKERSRLPEKLLDAESLSEAKRRLSELQHLLRQTSVDPEPEEVVAKTKAPSPVVSASTVEEARGPAKLRTKDEDSGDLKRISENNTRDRDTPKGGVLGITKKTVDAKSEEASGPILSQFIPNTVLSADNETPEKQRVSQELYNRNVNFREVQSRVQDLNSGSIQQRSKSSQVKTPVSQSAHMEVLADVVSPPVSESQTILELGQSRWIEDRFLLLVRRVSVGTTVEEQIAVIDWPSLRKNLLASITDLLPQAELEPQKSSHIPEHCLAALPLHLKSGPLPPLTLDASLRTTLIFSWTALLIGLVGAVGILIAAQRLAEKRAAFVSAVTHELRTPLTALRLHADLLGDSRIDQDTARRQAKVGLVRAEATRLAHLIDNVLDYARLERRRAPQSRPLPLVQVLDPVIPMLEERLRTAGLSLAHAPLPAAIVRCDPGAVSRILINLADNAAKYAATSDRPLELSVLVGRRLEIHLRDHGPGLAPDARARLFAPFARSAEAAAGNAPGVGLGLALCRRLARAQGGELRLEEPEDGGVDAILELPLG